jgi:hypothetical protein
MFIAHSIFFCSIVLRSSDIDAKKNCNTKLIAEEYITLLRIMFASKRAVVGIKVGGRK